MNNPPSTSNLVNPGHESHTLNGNLYRYTQLPPFLPNAPPSEVIQQMDEYPSRQVPDSALLTHKNKYMLLSLLSKWNLKFLYNTLAEALVDIDALQFITPDQCESLLSSYPLGIRIKFTAQVTQLQREFARASQIDQRALAPLFANTYL